MIARAAAISLTLTAVQADAAHPALAAKPPMGWGSWYGLECRVDSAARVRTIGQTDIWVRTLANGDHVIAFVNRGEVGRTVTISWDDLGVSVAPTRVRDLWRGSDRVADCLTATVRIHGVALFRAGRSS